MQLPSIHSGSLPVSSIPLQLDRVGPDQLAELIAQARLRGIRLEDSPEVQEAMRRFLERFKSTSGRFSKNTWRQLESSWSLFVKWCDSNSLIPLPAEPETVNRYLSHRGMTVHRNSLKVDLWAIGRVHRAAGCPNPAADSQVADSAAAISRRKVEEEEEGVSQASAMRETHLDELLTMWRKSPSLTARRDLALLTLAYETMLREAELARVKLKHIAMQPDGGAILTIPITKTNHSGEPEKVALSRQCMMLIVEYLELAGRELDAYSDAALLGSVSRFGKALKRGAPLTTKTIERVFARAHKALGLDKLGVRPWSGHSARVGAAQDLAADGYNALQIMKAGRWSSEVMVMRYCRDIFAHEGAMAKRRAGRV